jgi:anti-sigma factor RsiW
MRDTPDSVPDFLLERYALGELSHAEMDRIRDLLAADPALRERLRRLEESSYAILEHTSPDDFARRLLVRADAESRREDAHKTLKGRDGIGAGSFPVFPGNRRPLWNTLAGLGTLALVILAAVPAWRALRAPADPLAGAELAYAPETPGAPGHDGAEPGVAGDAEGAGAAEEAGGTEPAVEHTRIKGLEPRLTIFRKTKDGAEPLRPGEKARSGEFLRIGYHAAGFGYGAIVSVDGNGNVTRHWPADGDRAARLERGEALLPNAFELDAAPDFERFYLVVSKRPFRLDPLLESLHRDGSTTTPLKQPDAKIVRFDVLKDSVL